MSRHKTKGQSPEAAELGITSEEVQRCPIKFTYDVPTPDKLVLTLNTLDGQHMPWFHALVTLFQFLDMKSKELQIHPDMITQADYQGRVIQVPKKDSDNG